MESVDPVGILGQVSAASDENAEPNTTEAPQPPGPKPKQPSAAPRKRGATRAESPRRDRRALAPTTLAVVAHAEAKAKTRPSARPAPLAKRRRLGATSAPPADAVIVPATCFPDEDCSENGGAGWSATATLSAKGCVNVTFTHARDEAGRRFASVAMRASALTYVEARPSE